MSDQDGLATLEQARDHGVSREAVQRRVAAKEWLRVAPRVVQDASHQLTPHALVRAAVLSLGDDAVLVGDSAAWWYGLLEQRPRRVAVAVGRTARRRARPGVDLVLRDVPARDRTRHRRLAVTTLAPTVLDAAVTLGLIEGAKLLDTALQRRKVTVEGLRAARTRRSGRPGAQLLAQLLTLAEGGAVSEAERRTHAQLRAAAIVGWVANLPVDLPGFGRAVLDVAFPELKVLVEVDGWAYHRDLKAFLRDAARQNALAAAGWIVVRTNWHEVTGTPEMFLAHLRQVLATRS
ncbi:DUF559 domain-containing protein [Actinomycetospora termitidis]|uniref:DUF559 domain-containing protein n=1 Tax=Actinomycetospora termitidis TaxID=3053470 RepID=A0ABT7M1V4_9PSEU|nr:DUF559 domain-containing protein [Actinomycetospora sp. Odt1-22]MDL5154635.1 DUF559 domain-containing protein [Actinomycetospora sp. Odt1-22]